MAALGGLFILIGFALFVLAAVAFFKPLPQLKLGTRKAAAIGLALSVGSCVAGGAITPPSPATTDTSKASTTKPGPVKSAEQEKVTVDSSEVKKLWADLLVAVGECDRMSKRVATESDGLSNGQSDVYSMYEQVTGAQSACQDASMALMDLSPPQSARGETKAAFKDALSRCSIAYAAKQMGYGSMAKVLNGDMRPSAVSDAKQSMESASAQQLGCVAAFLGAAMEAGVTLEDLNDQKS